MLADDLAKARRFQSQGSSFGEFVHSQDQIVREGLLGGSLSTAWALLNLDHNQPKLTYEGLKKVDGRQFHDLRYRCKRNDDMNIYLYFDPETYRHGTNGENVLPVVSITMLRGRVEGLNKLRSAPDIN
jgi:hypothetical protein